MTGRKIRIRFILLTITLLLFLMQGAAFAKEAEFILSADTLKMQLGVSNRLFVSLVNAQGAKITEIKGIESFDILSTSQSSSTQIVNNDITNKKDITYIIMPKKAGTFTLQASIQYNGKTVQTNELTIEVSEISNEMTGGEAQDIFVKTILSNDTIYFGQKAVLTYELYSRYNIENFGFLEALSMDGFVLNDIPEEQLNASYVYLNDNKYVKYEAKQTILTPIRTGTFTIPACKFQANVGTGGFFSSSEPVYLQTEQKELTVKPLPTGNRPKNFSGVVGKLNLESSYSRQEVEYGDSITLKVKASGSCNLDMLDQIIQGGIPGFSVYETEKDVKESIENSQYHASKEFEIILVPEKNGDLNIEPMVISYFDPETGSYEQAEIPGTTITVKGDMPVAQGQSGARLMETVKIEQVSYGPKNEEYLTIRLKRESLLAGVIILVLLTAGGVAVVILFRNRKQNGEWKAFLRQGKRARDPKELLDILNQMMKYRFNLSLMANSRETIERQLSQYGIAAPVLEILDAVEYHRAEDIVTLRRKFQELCQKIK